MGSQPADGKAVIRMPKADVAYTYYDSDGSTGQYNDIEIAVNANRGRLWSDELASEASFTQTITNSTSTNNFFLVNNPFIANMDMKTFFDANPQFEKKYWIMSAKGQIVKVQATGTTWIEADGSGAFAEADAKVGPLQGFFVTTGSSVVNTTDVTFTSAMQEAAASVALATRAEAAAPLSQLAIHATRQGYTSTAVVALSADASNDYKADEDAQTFVDGNVLSEPTIYTVASGQAMTINTLSNLEVLPLGIVDGEKRIIK